MIILKSLLLPLLIIIPINLDAQDVGFYINEMNTSAEMDSNINAVIDSIWNASNEGVIDSSNYLKSANFLHDYYDSGSNLITGDKAELYGYFILLKHKDHEAIINRFESKLNDYNHRTFTTISEIHRRAFIKHHKGNIKDYRAHLLKLENQDISENLKAFLDLIKEIRPGEKCPDFTVTDLAGNAHTLQSLKGKVVVLDFWATWCGPCIKDLPNIKQAHEEYGSNTDFLLISISLDKDEMKLKNFVRYNNISWPQVMDASPEDKSGNYNGVMATLFKSKGIPKYFLIDKEGYIRYNSSLADNSFVPNRIMDRYLQKK